MEKNKIIVGLTGAFGSGKSTVGHMMETLGACLLDADALAHEALLEGGPVYEKIASLFPQAAGSKGLDRAKIAEVVFKDAVKRKELESIIHPYVRQRLIEEASSAEEKVVIMEIPLLFEAGFDRFCDFTVVVSAPDSVRAERLRAKGYKPEEIEARSKAQLPMEEKIKRAQVVINNSGVLEQTKREVENFWKKTAPVSKGEQ